VFIVSQSEFYKNWAYTWFFTKIEWRLQICAGNGTSGLS